MVNAITNETIRFIVFINSENKKMPFLFSSGTAFLIMVSVSVISC